MAKTIHKDIKIIPLLLVLLSFYYLAIFDKQYPKLVFVLMVLSIGSLYFFIIRGNLSLNLFKNIRKQEGRVLFFLVANAVLLIVVMIDELEFDYKNLALNIAFMAMKAIFTLEILVAYLINFSKLEEPVLIEE
ncbi:hypothetical protein VRU48_01860 [Pedobacter sp. KR3-3]|uniref:Uncharacterized protein n=1 Tax=Pedobacter albus TaxID=3113905 RepID=A0ABU7I309_9SPHI|nr:hypothetical protein [Pedobacter sp. KR3-3]MEE1943833.1 hypothetical protein [Pedobacter sp. KR3-3]